MHLLPILAAFRHHLALRNLTKIGLKDDLPFFHALWAN